MAPINGRSIFHVWFVVSALANFIFGLKSAHETKREPSSCAWPLPSSLTHSGPSSCPLPMDDSVGSSADEWLPWSHRPYCVQPANRTDWDPKYCVYTMDSFRGGRGISIILTPDIAASLVNSLDDSVVRPELRDHPSSRLSGGSGRELAYEIRDLLDRGKGVVARRKIRQWEVIMVDFPSIIAPMDLFSALSAEQKQRILRRAVNRLPQPRQTAITSLARTFGGDPMVDILRTNILGIDVNGTMYMGLFVDGSVSRLGRR
jgi:hypothetical protein